MKNRQKVICALMLVAATGASSSPAISTATAAAVFARANALCAADDGRLWGVSLCVPMMFVDPNTLTAVANRNVRGATPDGNVFRFTFPSGTQVANAPMSYAGIRWAQIQWPVFGDSETQAVTLMHESFHVVQPKLGFNGDADMGSISGDSFLDTQPGRIWLRGEMHALRAALQNAGADRTRALRDALTMRFYRHTLSISTAELERQLDVLEGLAEGTGIDAGLPPGRRIAYALRDLAFVESQKSYARSFAYATGPAYTELLDASQSGWRRRVTTTSDVARMTMQAYGLHVAVPSAAQAQAAIVRYDGIEIEAQEAALAARRTQLDAKYRRELVNGPTLALPLVKFHIRFDPRDIETLGSAGSVYHSLALSAAWGSLEVKGGDVLITTDFKTVRVVAPPVRGGPVVRGAGWTLHLAPGYSIVGDSRRSGSFTVAH